MPGARCTRSLACESCREHTSIVTVGSPDQPGIPARNGFNGFLRDLPGDRAWLSPSPAVCLRKLDASVEASGPHDFAVRLGAVRQRHLRVHRIPPRVRDDRDTPLWWDETVRTTVVICLGRKPKYFSKWGWTGKSADQLLKNNCPLRWLYKRSPDEQRDIRFSQAACRCAQVATDRL